MRFNVNFFLTGAFRQNIYYVTIWWYIYHYNNEILFLKMGT